jgi:hypothetical protein
MPGDKTDPADLSTGARPGDVVLVTDATDEVGGFVLKVAGHRGIFTVALGRLADTELLERLGAWRVLLTPWVPVVRTGYRPHGEGDAHGRGDAPPVVGRGRGAPAKPGRRGPPGAQVAGQLPRRLQGPSGRRT